MLQEKSPLNLIMMITLSPYIWTQYANPTFVPSTKVLWFSHILLVIYLSNFLWHPLRSSSSPCRSSPTYLCSPSSRNTNLPFLGYVRSIPRLFPTDPMLLWAFDHLLLGSLLLNFTKLFLPFESEPLLFGTTSLHLSAFGALINQFGHTQWQEARTAYTVPTCRQNWSKFKLTRRSWIPKSTPMLGSLRRSTRTTSISFFIEFHPFRSSSMTFQIDVVMSKSPLTSWSTSWKKVTLLAPAQQI